MQYSPYGSIISSTGTLPTDRLFTGQRFESGIGLYDYRARFYDPLVGSFISADSIVPEPGHPRGWNRYAYVNGNPVRYNDPSGHEPPCPGVINCLPPPDLSLQFDGKIFFVNGLAQHEFGEMRLEEINSLANEYTYLFFRLKLFAGENVTHIPVYNTGYDDIWQARYAMYSEAFGYRKIFAHQVAETIATEYNPELDGKLIIVGSSAGGTSAIEALDILEEKGIFVDQVILRGSFVSELFLDNVGRVDYIAPESPFWSDMGNYSIDVNPFDAVTVQEHQIPGFTAHVPPSFNPPERGGDNGRIMRQIGSLVIDLISGR